MKIIEIIGHQGDTQWAKIDEIPTSAKSIDKVFIAKSERTGSVHALSGNYQMYEYEDGFAIECMEDCILNHTFADLVEKEMNSTKILPKKDHRHSVIKKGLYLVGIQNRFDPMEASKKKVVD
jgi:hypothetical protein